LIEGRTQSSASSDLVVQRMRTKFGGRASVVAGRAAWNCCRAPFATFHLWTVSRRLWRHFCSLPIFTVPFCLGIGSEQGPYN